MADIILFSTLGLSGTGPVKQVGPKSFVVGALPQSDITNLVTDLAGKYPLLRSYRVVGTTTATITAADAGNVIHSTNTGNCRIFLPSSSTDPTIPIGAVFQARSTDVDGMVEFFPEGDVQLYYYGGRTVEIFQTLTVEKISATEYTMVFGGGGLGLQNLANVSIGGGLIDAVTIGSGSPCLALYTNLLRFSADANQTDMTAYEAKTYTWTWGTGLFSSGISVAFSAVRDNGRVTLRFNQIQSTVTVAGTTLTSASVLDARFRPPATVYGPVIVKSNGVTQNTWGRIFVSSTGQIQFAMTPDAATNFAAGSSGTYEGSISYNVN